MSAGGSPTRPDLDPRLDPALQLASRFIALVKSGRAYSVGHAGVTQQIENYLVLLEPVLHAHGHARLDAPDGELCLNGEHLPFRHNTQRALEQLVQEFAARSLVGIEFTSGLTTSEFQSFMDLFLQGERWKGQEFATACRDAGIVHLHVLTQHSAAADRGTAAAADSLPQVLGASRAAWVALLTGSQYVLSGDALDHGVELRHLKRIAQPMVDSVLAGEPIVAALARVSPSEPAWAHAAHTALTVVSVGARLGLGRRDLAELAVSALLHDVGHDWTEANAATLPAPHTLEGVRRIASATTFNPSSLDAMRTALEHHGAHGENELPRPALLSQLVATADAYVTFLSRGGAHAELISPHSALTRVLERLRADDLPAVGVALVRALGFYPPGQLVELDDSAIARALVPVADDPERPWVQLVTDARGTLLPRVGVPAMPLATGTRIVRALPRDQWPVDDVVRKAA